MDLENAILRTKRINKAQLIELQDSLVYQTDGRSHIAAKNRRGIDLVAIADVRLFQADHKYVTAYHTQGEALLDETLKELEDEFENRFFRMYGKALI